MRTVRLTAAQATVRFLAAQKVEIDGRRQRLFEGVIAIFGHGNVSKHNRDVSAVARIGMSLWCSVWVGVGNGRRSL